MIQHSRRIKIEYAGLILCLIVALAIAGLLALPLTTRVHPTEVLLETP